MADAFKRFAAMKRNPRNDWAIGDVLSFCVNSGLHCHPPSRGSHYVVSHPAIDGLLTIPATSPIKPIYIMLLVEMAEAVLELA